MNTDYFANYEVVCDDEAKVFLGHHFGKVINLARPSSEKKTRCSTIVAIKKLRKGDDMMKNLLIENETRIVKKLNHPNIVQYLQIVETPECNHIVMEMICTGDLDIYNAMAIYTKFDIHAILEQILNALYYLHKTCKIVHRDIKLANILVQWSPPDFSLVVKLCDFGVSYCKDDDKNGIGRQYFGTHPYMAPEVMQHKPHSYAVDMWGLGVCMYQMFTKRLPFKYPKEGNVPYNPELLVYETPDNMTELEKALLQSLLCLDPEDRISAKVALLFCKECAADAKKNDEPSRKKLSKRGLL